MIMMIHETVLPVGQDFVTCLLTGGHVFTAAGAKRSCHFVLGFAKTNYLTSNYSCITSNRWPTSFHLIRSVTAI